MGLKILHSADWHLDSAMGTLDVQLRQELSDWLGQLPERIADLCIQEKCDLVLLAGDLFDGIPGRESVETVKRALKRCAVPVLIAPGNHDHWGKGPWQEAWPENVHIFPAGELTAVELPVLDCRVYGAGYRSMDCPGLLEGFRTAGAARYHVAVLHGDPMVMSSPCCPVTALQVRHSGLDYLALGHIHRRGRFQAANTLCAWPGCPVGRGWDETGEKGVYILELGETAGLRFVPLGAPEFVPLTVSVNGDGAAELSGVLPPVESKNVYRVRLTGVGEPDTEALRQQFDHLPYLELRDETEDAGDPWEYAGDDSLRGVYFRMLREQYESAGDEQRDIVFRAAEISRRLLDGKEVKLP